MTEYHREGVDADLVKLFLDMTPEERIQANDNAIQAIWELRNAAAQKAQSPGSESAA